MKLTVNVKLQPTAEQFAALKTTLERCNGACNFVSEHAWQSKTFGQYKLQKAVYYEIRESFDLGAQVAVRCIAKVSDAYELDTKKQRQFRQHAAQPFDDRIFRFIDNRWLSIWTLGGREKMRYAASRNQRELLKQRKGDVDLMLIRGTFYIGVVVDVDDVELLDPKSTLRVDFGIKTRAVDSQGDVYSGESIDEK